MSEPSTFFDDREANKLLWDAYLNEIRAEIRLEEARMRRCRANIALTIAEQRLEIAQAGGRVYFNRMRSHFEHEYGG